MFPGEVVVDGYVRDLATDECKVEITSVEYGMPNEKLEVMVKCKRGSDRLTEGQHCDSKTAEQLSDPGSRIASFRCKKCGYSWDVPLGGSFDEHRLSR